MASPIPPSLGLGGVTTPWANTLHTPGGERTCLETAASRTAVETAGGGDSGRRPHASASSGGQGRLQDGTAGTLSAIVVHGMRIGRYGDAGSSVLPGNIWVDGLGRRAGGFLVGPQRVHRQAEVPRGAEDAHVSPNAHVPEGSAARARGRRARGWTPERGGGMSNRQAITIRRRAPAADALLAPGGRPGTKLPG